MKFVIFSISSKFAIFDSISAKKWQKIAIRLINKWNVNKILNYGSVDWDSAAKEKYRGSNPTHLIFNKIID